VSPYVTVVVPNWNGERFLNLCLTSLRRQSFEDFETILVDNGSTDASVDFVKRNFPEVRVVSLTHNRGFSAAVNAGIQASQAEYVVLLNNDTEVDPGWLKALVRAAESHPEAGFLTGSGTGSWTTGSSRRKPSCLVRARRGPCIGARCSRRSDCSTRISSRTARMGT
jgi:glycosyltransferase involved in cell wall biosynthesis